MVQKPISVVLVDDSAIIRGGLSRILEARHDIEVLASCSNGEIGIHSCQKEKPDVVILDVEMPVMDGLSALPKILEVSPHTKVIMFSSLTAKGAETTIKALSLGATECLGKPTSGQNIGPGSEFQRRLISLICSLGAPEGQIQDMAAPKAISVSAAAAPLTEHDEDEHFTLYRSPSPYIAKPEIIAIGCSTGGPNALFEVTPHLRGLQVPIIITQHMPATFTRILAQHIEQKSYIPAHEGTEGMILEKGHIYLAPGGYHMRLQQKDSGAVHICLDDSAPINFCRPSVDPMFQSASDIYEERLLAVMLTGMGNDGLQSSKNLVERGARLIAQNKETSVVWGMPRAVALAGICSDVLPLCDIGPRIRKECGG